MLADRIKARLKVNANAVHCAEHIISSVTRLGRMSYFTSELMTVTRFECLLMLSKQSHQLSFKLTSIPHTHTNPKLLAVRAHHANALADVPSKKHICIWTHKHTHTHKEIQTCGISCGMRVVISAVLWAREKR